MMYQSKLTIKETQKAIKIVKDNFEARLATILNLDRVSAPIIVESNKGINDDLGMKDSALKFHIDKLNQNVEIVQSLAKWKRIALKRYGYLPYEGIYTDMNAIRPKDEIDNTHSLYVDQWDWELVILEKDRTIDYLKSIVSQIVKALKDTKDLVIQTTNKKLTNKIEENVFFITAEELDLLYPNQTMRERERLITEKYKSVFVMKIGHTFKNGRNHDLRAPDYDDWQLNGDILLWSHILNDAVEVSSMGIRVNKDSLIKQLERSGRPELINNHYHQLVFNNELPLTIGGGIGQSRICMILLEKLHIAEVQASIWSADQLKYFEENKINYL